MVKQYAQLYLDARREFLKQEDARTASLLARSLLSHTSGKSWETLVAERENYAPQRLCEAMDASVARVLSGEPLAYVLEQWSFYGMTLYVNRDVLIPRDDTCAVTALAIRKGLFLDQDPRILDLCTGSGCIGLAIANRVKDAHVTLADLSREALAVAKKNVVNLKLSGRVSCIQVDVRQSAAPFLGKFDMIVANPPYVTTEEMAQLPHEVKDYEPHLALHGGEDGLDFYRAIIRNFTPALKPGGWLCLEFGMGQGDAVSRLLEESGYTELERTRDYNDRERALAARYGRKEEA